MGPEHSEGSRNFEVHGMKINNTVVHTYTVWHLIEISFRKKTLLFVSSAKAEELEA